MSRVLVFDSGVGGLSVLAELRNLSPELKVTYVADNAFFPYGNRTEPELKSHVPALLQKLCEVHTPDVVVIACNTASTIALDETRALLSCQVVGTVPAIKPAALKSETGVIGLLGTPGTVERQYTAELIEEYAPQTHVIRVGSAELVDLAEQKLRGAQMNFTELKSILERVTNAGRGHEMDTLVLACTHFPLLYDEIRHLLSPDIIIVDSGEAIARRTINRLAIANTGPADGDNVVVFTNESDDLPALEPALKALGIERVEYFDSGLD